jgi:hypothetical protein
LIASLRQRSFTAAAPRDFDDPSVLRLLNEKVTSYLLKLIAKRRTNFLVETVDISVQSGTAAYQVPSVAISGALRSVILIVGNIPYALIEMDLPHAVATNMVPLSTQFPVGYYFIGPNIQLWPTQSIGGILRIHYHRRPSVVVKESACIQITGFPGGAATGFYRVGFTGTAPAGYAVNAAVDVVSNIPNFYRWQTNVAINAITSTTLDLPVLPATSAQPASLQVGDWVCLYDTAPVITDSPAEVIEALLQSAAAAMLASKGAGDSYQRMKAELEQAEHDCGPLIQMRNTGAMRKLSAFPDAPGWPFSGWG